MGETFAASARVIAAAGDLWLYAIIVTFIAIVLEFAKPKAKEGEEREKLNFLVFLLGVANIITPFLLFLYGFQIARAETANPIGVVALLVAGPCILGALIGWTLSAAVPAFGRVLARGAPVLNAAAFALALYVAFPGVVPA